MGDRSPSIVPSNAERDIYLVLEDFGHTGRAWRETDEADTDRATLIQHLFEGQYTNPVRIVSSRETFEIGVWSVIRLCLTLHHTAQGGHRRSDTSEVTRSMLLAPSCSSRAAQPRKAIGPIQGKPESQTTAKLCVRVPN